MSRSLPASDWWYARLYPGGIDRLDAAVTSCLPELSALARTLGADRWFFIQYTDRRGPHLRFRVRGPRDALDRLHRVLPRLDADLVRLSRRPAPDRGSLVPLDLRPFSGLHAGADMAVYEREEAKYGGRTGTELAEEVFEHSSELALWAGGLPRQPDRAAIGMLLLHASASEIPQFWERHLAWWTHDAGRGAEELRTRLRNSADEGMPAIGERAMSLMAEPAVRIRVQDWARTLSHHLVRAAAMDIPYSPGHLVFHQVHMMCNRLGILPREEALLGIMASRWAGDSTLAHKALPAQ